MALSGWLSMFTTHHQGDFISFTEDPSSQSCYSHLHSRQLSSTCCIRCISLISTAACSDYAESCSLRSMPNFLFSWHRLKIKTELREAWASTSSEITDSNQFHCEENSSDKRRFQVWTGKVKSPAEWNTIENGQQKLPTDMRIYRWQEIFSAWVRTSA